MGFLTLLDPNDFENKFKGKTVTLSAYVTDLSDDTIFHMYFQGADSRPITRGLNTRTVTVNGTNRWAGITRDISTISGWIKIKWMKLEYGTVATPFVPPDPAIELLKCQRYYQRIGRMMRHVGSGIIIKNCAMIVCPLATNMRITGPTINIVGTMYIWTGTHTGNSAVASTELASAPGVDMNALTLPVSITTTNDDIGNGATLQFRDADSYIELSAEL